MTGPRRPADQGTLADLYGMLDKATEYADCLVLATMHTDSKPSCLQVVSEDLWNQLVKVRDLAHDLIDWP